MLRQGALPASWFGLVNGKPDLLVDLDLPAPTLQPGNRLRPKPWPVEVRGVQVRFGKPGELGRSLRITLSLQSEKKTVTGLRPKVSQAHLGELLGGVFLSMKIAHNFQRSLWRFNHRRTVPAGVQGKFMVAVTHGGPRHQPVVAVGDPQ